MPWTHHSHSGQFCGHATGTLEEVILMALAKSMTTICLTEHIPRKEIDFYEEEIPIHTEESLMKLFVDYHAEANRLRDRYQDRIEVLVGFEGEWIRDTTLEITRELLAKYEFDLFVGSVHHVHTVPIDMDAARFSRAMDLAGGTEDKLFIDFFNAQYDMLSTLRPPVVGHFDLIRLRSQDPERSFQTWPKVWEKIERNLRFIAEYGGVVELNSSALRKGMSEMYPGVEICRVGVPT